MSLTIYTFNGSPPARAVMMVAEILGIKYNSHEINPVLREQDTPELIKKNPMRTIPFIDDDGYCLGDSHAIMLYLFDKYGKPEHSYLYPTDKRKRATINQRLFFDCGVLFPRLRSVMVPTYLGKVTEISNTMKINIDYSYRMLEAYLSDTLYLADNVVTLADLSVITTMSSLHGIHPIDSNKYPKLMKWFSNMSDQEICKKVNESGAKEHVESIKRFMEINKLNQNKKSKL